MALTSLSDIYQNAITKALDTNYTLPESVIDRIHNEIIQEISTKRHHGNRYIRYISSGLGIQYEVEPILQAAKRANLERKFAFDFWKSQGLYEGINCQIYSHEVLNGADCSGVKARIKKWLKDFGTENNKFSVLYYGTCNGVGNLLNKIDEELNIEYQLPGVLKCSKKSRDPGEYYPNNGFYFKVDPITMKCFIHDPSDVTIDEDEDLEYYAVSYDNIEFIFPVYRPSRVFTTADVVLEYSVTKGLFVCPWAAWISVGINALLYNKTTSEKFSHRFKIKIEVPAKAVKLRGRLKIEINREKAKNFLEVFQNFEKFTKALSGNEQPERIGNNDSSPDPQLVILFERFPWLQYIDILRRGGIMAANELIRKKPEILRNLPANTNHALGIAFEELQIAKVMAEARRRGVNLEHIAGDGRGHLRLDSGGRVQTPEHIDAVFRNMETGELFAVQFKYSDKIENLVGMMKRWRSKHEGVVQDANLPEPLHVDNVQVIGPRDVIQNVDTEGFSHVMDIGELRVPPDDREFVKQFLEENTELLQEIVNSPEWHRRHEIKLERNKLKNKLDKVNEKLQRLRDNLNSARQRGADSSNEGAITKLENKIRETELSKHNTQEQYDKANLEIKQIEEKTSAVIEERINPSYDKKTAKKQMYKEAALNIAIQAVTDGIITLIITSDQELRRYFRGEITLWECTKQITKSTTIATLRGGAVGLGFSGITMLARYAGLQGWRCAGALSTGAKLVGPALMAGLFMHESYSIVKHWKNSDITTAEMEKAIARNVSSTALSIGGTFAAGCLVGGPLGLILGAGVAISVAVGDYYLGDKVWSLVFKEDPEEAKALILKKYESLREDVLKAAYNLFNLTEYATKEEVKEAFRTASLKYHPDKGGNAEMFHAIYAAYELIRNSRK